MQRLSNITMLIVHGNTKPCMQIYDSSLPMSLFYIVANSSAQSAYLITFNYAKQAPMKIWIFMFVSYYIYHKFLFLMLFEGVNFMLNSIFASGPPPHPICKLCELLMKGRSWSITCTLRPILTSWPPIHHLFINSVQGGHFSSLWQLWRTANISSYFIQHACYDG